MKYIYFENAEKLKNYILVLNLACQGMPSAINEVNRVQKIRGNI